MKPVKCMLIAISLSVAFISCEKDSVSIVENTDIPLISLVKSVSDTTTEYTYNAENLVIEEKSKYFFVSHDYNNQNQVVVTKVYFDENLASSAWEVAQAAMNRTEWVNPDNTPLTSSQTYTYNDSGLLVAVNIHRGVSNMEHSELSYNLNGRISRHTYFLDNKISVYFDYVYDQTGNVTKTSKYWVPLEGEPVLTVTYEFEYDNKLNPYKAFKRLILPGINGINTNENNIIKETFTPYAEFESSSPLVTETTYEYNDRGYPVKKGDGVVFEYKE